MNQHEPEQTQISEERKVILKDSIDQVRRLTPWGAAFFVTGIGATGAFIAKIRLEDLVLPIVFNLVPFGLGIVGAYFQLVLSYRYKTCRREFERGSYPEGHRLWWPGAVGKMFTFIPLVCGIPVTIGLFLL